MKRLNRFSQEITRRGFIQGSAAGVLGASVLGGCSHSRKDWPPLSSEYRLVPGWQKDSVPPIKTRGLDADSEGQIYVTGDEEHPVMMLNRKGEFLGSWGKYLLMGAHGLRIRNDEMWVSDTVTHQVHKFALDGTLIRSFGIRGEASGAPGYFDRPTDFAFGPNGDIYVSDGYGNTRVVCYSPDGRIKRIWGEKGDGPSQFDLVHAIAIDGEGRVYVGDRNNDRVQIFDLDGNYITQWDHIGKPYGLYTFADKTIFLCGIEAGSDRFRVLRLDRNGEVLCEFGETGEGPGQFLMAHSIYVDKMGAVYVADGKSQGIQKFEPIVI